MLLMEKKIVHIQGQSTPLIFTAALLGDLDTLTDLMEKGIDPCMADAVSCHAM